MMLRFDIAIVGCGLIGGILALALNKLGLKIAVIEKKSLVDLSSGKDYRASALSFGNFRYIQEIVENDARFSGSPIKKILAEDGILGPKINFSADDLSPGSYFGINVPNEILKTVVYEHLYKTQISFFQNTTLEEINLESKLTIAADGRNSKFINQLSSEKFNIDYDQTAYVATLQLRKPIDIAYERFFKTGPIALLPLPLNQASLIWSLENHLIVSMKENLKEFIQIHLEGVLENDFDILYQGYFPLKACFVLPPYSHRLLLMGDAAHSMHPVAGQGLNLGVRNIKELVQLTQRYLSSGLDIGSENFLQEYWGNTKGNVFALMSSTHGLIRLFDFESKMVSSFKRLGMRIFEKSETLKKTAAYFASH